MSQQNLLEKRREVLSSHSTTRSPAHDLRRQVGTPINAKVPSWVPSTGSGAQRSLGALSAHPTCQSGISKPKQSIGSRSPVRTIGEGVPYSTGPTRIRDPVQSIDSRSPVRTTYDGSAFDTHVPPRLEDTARTPSVGQVSRARSIPGISSHGTGSPTQNNDQATARTPSVEQVSRAQSIPGISSHGTGSPIQNNEVVQVPTTRAGEPLHMIPEPPEPPPIGIRVPVRHGGDDGFQWGSRAPVRMMTGNTTAGGRIPPRRGEEEYHAPASSIQMAGRYPGLSCQYGNNYRVQSTSPEQNNPYVQDAHLHFPHRAGEPAWNVPVSGSPINSVPKSPGASPLFPSTLGIAYGNRGRSTSPEGRDLFVQDAQLRIPWRSGPQSGNGLQQIPKANLKTPYRRPVDERQHEIAGRRHELDIANELYRRRLQDKENEPGGLPSPALGSPAPLKMNNPSTFQELMDSTQQTLTEMEDAHGMTFADEERISESVGTRASQVINSQGSIPRPTIAQPTKFEFLLWADPKLDDLEALNMPDEEIDQIIFEDWRATRDPQADPAIIQEWIDYLRLQRALRRMKSTISPKNKSALNNDILDTENLFKNGDTPKASVKLRERSKEEMNDLLQAIDTVPDGFSPDDDNQSGVTMNTLQEKERREAWEKMMDAKKHDEMVQAKLQEHEKDTTELMGEDVYKEGDNSRQRVFEMMREIENRDKQQEWRMLNYGLKEPKKKYEFLDWVEKRLDDLERNQRLREERKQRYWQDAARSKIAGDRIALYESNDVELEKIIQEWLLEKERMLGPDAMHLRDLVKYVKYQRRIRKKIPWIADASHQYADDIAQRGLGGDPLEEFETAFKTNDQRNQPHRIRLRLRGVDFSKISADSLQEQFTKNLLKNLRLNETERDGLDVKVRPGPIPHEHAIVHIDEKSNNRDASGKTPLRDNQRLSQ